MHPLTKSSRNHKVAPLSTAKVLTFTAYPIQPIQRVRVTGKQGETISSLTLVLFTPNASTQQLAVPINFNPMHGLLQPQQARPRDLWSLIYGGAAPIQLITI